MCFAQPTAVAPMYLVAFLNRRPARSLVPATSPVEHNHVPRGAGPYGTWSNSFDGPWLVAGSVSDDQSESQHASREPKSMFEHRTGDPNAPDMFSVWNCVLFQDTPGASQGPTPSSSERHAQLESVALRHSTWAVVLSSGGHFAAGIFDMRSGSAKCPAIRALNVSRTGEWPLALDHKTLHRCLSCCSLWLMWAACVSMPCVS